MKASDPLSRFPEIVRHSTERPDLVYRRVPGLFAVQGALAEEDARKATLRLEGGIALIPGEPGAKLAPEKLAPAYSLESGGPPAVPTGRIFVRFNEGVGAGERRESLERAGYKILEVPDYAPHAAWVEAHEGGAAASLKGLSRLEALPEVANVEPQMLSEARRR